MSLHPTQNFGRNPFLTMITPRNLDVLLHAQCTQKRPFVYAMKISAHFADCRAYVRKNILSNMIPYGCYKVAPEVSFNVSARGVYYGIHSQRRRSF